MEPSYLFSPLQRSGHYMYHLLEHLWSCAFYPHSEFCILLGNNIDYFMH